MRIREFVFLGVVVLMAACSLPERKLSQFSLEPNYSETADSITMRLQNSLACPLRLAYYYAEADVDQQTVLQADSVWEVTFAKNGVSLKEVIEGNKFRATLGDPSSTKIDSSYQYLFPFPKGKTYKVIQAYNGSFSHNNNYSRFALDLDLAIGDTVCAARDGVVVGVIEGYDVGGSMKRYRPYANYISVYHNDGTLAQYVHLKHEGAFVEVGDTVTTQMPIGLSGNTGHTSTPHLHFNVLAPSTDSFRSIPIKFLRIDGKAVKEGFTLSH